MNGGTYRLTSTPNDRFLRNFFIAGFILLSEFVTEICWEEVAEEILFIIHFWWLTRDTNPGFSSNKPTHYILDHGDFFSFALSLKKRNVKLHIKKEQKFRSETMSESKFENNGNFLNTPRMYSLLYINLMSIILCEINLIFLLLFCAFCRLNIYNFENNYIF